MLRDRKFLRFLLAGGINTLFGFVLYSACIAAGAPIWAALLIGTIAAVFFNFFTTGSYVFRQLSLKRFPRFVLCYAIVYFANLGAIDLLSVWVTDKILAQALLVLPMALLSYFLMLKLVFSPTAS